VRARAVEALPRELPRLPATAAAVRAAGPRHRCQAVRDDGAGGA
jgi:hypothetical protein